MNVRLFIKNVYINFFIVEIREIKKDSPLELSLNI